MPENVVGSPRLGRYATVTVALVVALVVASCSSSKATTAATTTASTAPSTATSSTSSPPTAVPCTTGPHAAGESTQTLHYLGVARTYELYVPKAYTGTTAVPVVFNFHGFGSNAKEQMVYGNFMPLAEANHFLIVAPDGQGAVRHFNLTSEKGLQNDVAMVGALLDHIESTFCVDRTRVFATGMSDGGAMTSALACFDSDRFAAFGPVAVQISPPKCRAHPVSMLAIHGTADPVVPYAGGKVTCCGNPVVGSSPKAMDGWAAHDRCNATFTDTKLSSEVSRRTWTGCVGTSAVEFYTVIGGGHTWPGSIPIASLGMTTSQLKASAVIWAFFAAHPLSS